MKVDNNIRAVTNQGLSTVESSFQEPMGKLDLESFVSDKEKTAAQDIDAELMKPSVKSSPSESFTKQADKPFLVSVKSDSLHKGGSPKSMRTQRAYPRGHVRTATSRSASAPDAVSILRLMKTHPTQALEQAKQLMQSNPKEGAKLLQSLVVAKDTSSQSMAKDILGFLVTNADSILEIIGTAVEVGGALTQGLTIQGVGALLSFVLVPYSAYSSLASGHNAIMKSHTEEGAYQGLASLSQGNSIDVQKMADAYRQQITQGYPGKHLQTFKKDFDERVNAFKKGLQQALQLKDALRQQKKWGTVSSLLQLFAKKTSIRKAVKTMFKSVVEGKR
ncbi:MAG: hypothetical protein EP343_27355 [Deltaproteobacteria bacterium]|nr:MAG: hypothetical protein EP343_27355 [Deltaproteobacteria bacterium]